MSLFKKISNFLGGPREAEIGGAVKIGVKCRRCEETIYARVDLANDLSAEYGEPEQGTYYLCRKVLIGKQGCHSPIEVVLHFDADRNLIDQKITGGKFLEEDEGSGGITAEKEV